MGVSFDVSLGGKGGRSLSAGGILGGLLSDPALGGGSSGGVESLAGMVGRGWSLFLLPPAEELTFLEEATVGVAPTSGVVGSRLSWTLLVCLGEGWFVGTLRLRVFVGGVGRSQTDSPVVGL